ncbi:MAG: hypothetical protein ACTS4U_00705 [Candidatus Hodgkinia cicadicola]
MLEAEAGKRKRKGSGKAEAKGEGKRKRKGKGKRKRKRRERESERGKARERKRERERALASDGKRPSGGEREPKERLTASPKLQRKGEEMNGQSASFVSFVPLPLLLFLLPSFFFSTFPRASFFRLPLAFPPLLSLYRSTLSVLLSLRSFIYFIFSQLILPFPFRTKGKSADGYVSSPEGPIDSVNRV